MLYSRDAFRVALEMLADPTVSDADKDLIRQVLQEIHGSREPKPIPIRFIPDRGDTQKPAHAEWRLGSSAVTQQEHSEIPN